MITRLNSAGLVGALIAAVTVGAHAAKIDYTGGGVDLKEWNEDANWTEPLTGSDKIQFQDGTIVAIGGTTDFTPGDSMSLFKEANVVWESSALTLNGDIIVAFTEGAGATFTVTGGSVNATNARFGNSADSIVNVNLLGGAMTTTGSFEMNTKDDSVTTAVFSGATTLTTNKILVSSSIGSTLDWTVSGSDFVFDTGVFQSGTNTSASTTNLTLELGSSGFGQWDLTNFDDKNGTITNNLFVDVSLYTGTADVLLMDGTNNLGGFWDDSTLVGGGGFIDFDLANNDIYYRYAPIPEPSVLALLSLGCIGGLLLRKRIRP